MGNRKSRRAKASQDRAGQTQFEKLMSELGTLSAEQKACLGCMLGAFIGDSVGSYREFERGDCPDDLINKALEMPGGGCWRLSPG